MNKKISIEEYKVFLNHINNIERAISSKSKTIVDIINQCFADNSLDSNRDLVVEIKNYPNHYDLNSNIDKAIIKFDCFEYDSNEQIFLSYKTNNFDYSNQFPVLFLGMEEDEIYDKINADIKASLNKDELLKRALNKLTKNEYELIIKHANEIKDVKDIFVCLENFEFKDEI